MIKNPRIFVAGLVLSGGSVLLKEKFGWFPQLGLYSVTNLTQVDNVDIPIN